MCMLVEVELRNDEPMADMDACACACVCVCCAAIDLLLLLAVVFVVFADAELLCSCFTDVDAVEFAIVGAVAHVKGANPVRIDLAGTVVGYRIQIAIGARARRDINAVEFPIVVAIAVVDHAIHV